MNDKLRSAHDKLQEAVAEIVSGDEWKRMLDIRLRSVPSGCDLGGEPDASSGINTAWNEESGRIAESRL